MKNNLRKCPLCGNEADILKVSLPDDFTAYSVFCLNFSCKNHTSRRNVFYTTLEKAANSWNINENLPDLEQILNVSDKMIKNLGVFIS